MFKELAIYLTNIPLEICIGLQCIANVVMGIIDYKAWNIIWNKEGDL